MLAIRGYPYGKHTGFTEMSLRLDEALERGFLDRHADNPRDLDFNEFSEFCTRRKCPLIWFERDEHSCHFGVECQPGTRFTEDQEAAIFSIFACNQLPGSTDTPRVQSTSAECREIDPNKIEIVGSYLAALFGRRPQRRFSQESC
jgi:hypothetical protein